MLLVLQKKSRGPAVQVRKRRRSGTWSKTPRVDVFLINASKKILYCGRQNQAVSSCWKNFCFPAPRRTPWRSAIVWIPGPCIRFRAASWWRLSNGESTKTGRIGQGKRPSAKSSLVQTLRGTGKAITRTWSDWSRRGGMVVMLHCSVHHRHHRHPAPSQLTRAPIVVPIPAGSASPRPASPNLIPKKTASPNNLIPKKTASLNLIPIIKKAPVLHHHHLVLHHLSRGKKLQSIVCRRV